MCWPPCGSQFQYDKGSFRTIASELIPETGRSARQLRIRNVAPDLGGRRYR
jgi:hypothetical protein